MTGKRVLIVDDDPEQSKISVRLLEGQGFEVILAQDGQEGLRAVFEKRPDLVLLDIIMPGGPDGFEVCRRIRDMTDVPIIMLTGKKDDEDIIHGLELGADDYIVKPARPGVFMARVNAALRRGQLNPGDDMSIQQYEDEWLSIDIPTRSVTVNGEKVNMSATEFNLLSLLLRYTDRIVESETILKEVWGPEYQDEIAYVRVYVSHLRRKIEPQPDDPTYIRTERQVGYRFNRQDE